MAKKLDVTTLVVMFTAGDWVVCLVVFACLPVLGGAMGTALAAAMPTATSRTRTRTTRRTRDRSSARVVLGIRTVASFNAEVRYGLRGE